MSKVVEAEIVNQNQLVEVVKANQIEEGKSNYILEKFTLYFKEASQWEKKARAIVVKSIDDKDKMKEARDIRLSLKKIRCDAENTRKSLKDGIVREGKAIDGIANVIKALIVPLEEHLTEQENYIERLEEERKQKVASERSAELAKYNTDGTGLNLGEMDESIWVNYLAGVKKAHEDKVEAERIAEEERIALEKAEAEERERIRQENERLKKEAEEKERILAQERAERERAEKERFAKEATERKAREKAERKAEEERIRLEKEAEEKAEDKKLFEEVKGEFTTIQSAWVEIVRLRKILGEKN